jgi:hypothetical protein
VVARLRARALDRDLASGMLPWRSAPHAARSRQLTTERSRRKLARELERLIDDGGHRPNPYTATVPPCREQVREALPLLLSAASILRGRKPVDARGVAQLRRLLRDGGGPSFVRSRPDALAVVVDQALTWLRVPD